MPGTINLMYLRFNAVLIIVVAAGLGLGIGSSLIAAHRPASAQSWWNVQAIDTMKFSRDNSGQYLHDPETLKQVAEQQAHAISQTGATHIAIATPYDDDFAPILNVWVAAARDNGLKVWYRGNWAGWEGWFDHAKIDRATHLKKTEDFILAHPDLFRDGDVFTACPECENGGPGDPRMTGDAAGFRKFLIDEHDMMARAFATIKKDVIFNYNSMNGDVAKLTMDPATTTALGGIVTVDHYVSTPGKLAADLVALAESSQGSIVLGEFGAPIPDINGEMTEAEQAKWITDALIAIAPLKQIVGISYWTNQGGSTALWNENSTPRAAVAALTSFYTPSLLHGKVTSTTGEPLPGVTVSTKERTTVTDAEGAYVIPYVEPQGNLTASLADYGTVSVPIRDLPQNAVVMLPEPDRSWWGSLTHWFVRYSRALKHLFI